MIWDYLTDDRLRGLMDEYMKGHSLHISNEPFNRVSCLGYPEPIPSSVAITRHMMTDFELDNGCPETPFLQRPVKEAEIAEYVRERHLNLLIFLLDRALGVDWFGPMRDGLAAVLKGTMIDVNCRGYMTVIVPDTPPPGYWDGGPVEGPYYCRREDW